MKYQSLEEKDYQEAFILLKQAVFKHLNDAELHSILKQSELRELEAGEVLFSNGEASNYVYIILYGRLGNYLSITPDLEQGPYGFFQRGSLIGEVGVILNSPRTMGVVAQRNTQLLQLPAEIFKKFYTEVIITNQKELQELYFTQLDRSRKMFRRMRKEISYTFKTLIPLQRNLPIQEIIRGLENLNDNQQQFYILNAEDLKSISSEHGRIHYYLEQLGTLYKNILIIMSEDTTDFIEYALDISDKVILIANGDEIPANNPSFNQLISTQNKFPHTVEDLILIQPNRSAPRYGQRWTALKPSLRIRYYFRDNDSLARLYRYFSGQQIGLVLSGAGYRGMAHIGILKALIDYKIPIDVIGGTSIGAIIGASFAAAADMDQFDLLMQQLEKSIRRLFSWKELGIPILSIFTGRSRQILDELLPVDQIENTAIPFFCISCDLSHMKEIHHSQGHLATALRASSAIPGLLPPVIANGHLLVDGGVVNNLPVDVMRSHVDYSGAIIGTDLSGIGRIMDYMPIHTSGRLQTIRKLFWKKKNDINIGDILLESLLFSQHTKEKENIKLATACIQPHLATSALLPAKQVKQAQLIKAGYDATVTVICHNFHFSKYLQKG
jgi:predicted acylesterase/phospholipase RssA/CRP-like cAMP-binding protein